MVVVGGVEVMVAVEVMIAAAVRDNFKQVVQEATDNIVLALDACTDALKTRESTLWACVREHRVAVTKASESWVAQFRSSAAVQLAAVTLLSRVDEYLAQTLAERSATLAAIEEVEDGPLVGGASIRSLVVEVANSKRSVSRMEVALADPRRGRGLGRVAHEP
jgi:hypothetical protein